MTFVRDDDMSAPRDLYHTGVGRPGDKPPAMQVHSLVTEYADLVRGVFCGHMHNHIYAAIVTPSGRTTPRYVLTANAYRNGNVLHITVI